MGEHLHKNLQRAQGDSLEYEASRALYNYYEEVNRDSALHYADQDLLLARKNNKKLVEVMSLDTKGYQLLHMGRYSESLHCLLLAMSMAEDSKNEKAGGWTLSTSKSKMPGKERLLMLALCHHMMGILMWQTQNIEQEIFHFKEAGTIAASIDNPFRLLLANMNLGNAYLSINQPDSAWFFIKEAERISNASNIKKYLGHIYSVLGELSLNQGDKSMAKQYFYQGIALSIQQNNQSSLSRNYLRMTNFWLAEGQKDSTIAYAIKHMQVVKSLGGIMGLESNMGTAYENIYLGYRLRGQVDSAYKYQGLALVAKDSISTIRIKNLAEFQNANYSEQLRLQNLEKEKVMYQNKVKTYGFAAGTIILLLILLLLYRNNRQKHKANKKIEQAYDDLKVTQQQLIQSEKMASLGELTAGIAHEIQNPLNFVNNFSEVNNELIEELRIQKLKVKSQDPEEEELLNDIFQNNEKISFHGKRADAIVKGMLLHSRSSSGQKEPTDINALAGEYLQLAYHGLRAKDKSFNAALKTDYDTSIGMINLVPQDMGRVILNLITNAFYAVSNPASGKGEKINSAPGYQPAVCVTTKKMGDTVLISVKDNGAGIDKKILDKIFQPFFTTKPTGQGTGLGLSMAYDIVKAHGGDLKVETTENKTQPGDPVERGTVFTIYLPLT